MGTPSLLTWLQTTGSKLDVVGLNPGYEANPTGLLNSLLSYPNNPLRIYCVSDPHALEISRADDVLVHRLYGIAPEDLVEREDVLVGDALLLKERLKASIITSRRFGIEVFNETGGIEAFVVTAKFPDGKIGSLYDAEEVVITSFKGTYDERGRITQANVYPIELVGRPKFIFGTKEERAQSFVPRIIAGDKLGYKPIKETAASAAAHSPPNILALPGLGKTPQKPPTPPFLPSASVPTLFQLTGSSSIVKAGTATVPPLRMSLNSPFDGSADKMLEIGDFIHTQFLFATLFFHVMNRLEEVLQTDEALIRQDVTPSNAGGTPRLSTRGASISAARTIEFDLEAFTKATAVRRADFERALDDSRTFSFEGIIISSGYTTAAGRVVKPYSKYSNKLSDAEKTQLAGVKKDIDEILSAEPFDRQLLLDYMEAYGNPTSLKRLKGGVSVVKRITVAPKRNDPPARGPEDTKPDTPG